MKIIEYLKTLNEEDLGTTITAVLFSNKYPHIKNPIEIINNPEFKQLKTTIIDILNEEMTENIF